MKSIPYFDACFDASGLVQYTNCSVLRAHSLVQEDLWVLNGKILNPEEVFFDWRKNANCVVDCRGLLVVAGYIELQINGGFGIDFSSNGRSIQQNINLVAKKLLECGVTSFCPTIVSSSKEFYTEALPLVQTTDGSASGAGVLGLHLEGPFINKARCGAHPVQHIIDDFSFGEEILIDMYGCLNNVKLITLAPELPGAINVVRYLSERGIKVSVGHSSASLFEGELAAANGACCITHLFNAMLPFHHRDPGLVGLLTSVNIPGDHKMFYGVIADGIHTHDAALRIAHKVDPDGLVLVSDAVSAFGLGDGVHRLGDTNIEVRNNKAVICGKDTLVGSVSPISYCVKHFKKAARCSTVEAIECATLHPAQCLGITDRKGTLDYGTDADFILLDEELDVKATFISGERVWSKLMI